MQISSFKTLILSLTFNVLWANSSQASFDVEKLRLAKVNSVAGYSEAKTAMIQAISLGLLQSPGRLKIPGWGRVYFETGLQGFNIEDDVLANYTTNAFAPSAFFNIFGKVGVGLPFGFSLETGFSQIANEHRMNALNLALSYQLFDFSTWVYTDFVPAVTASAASMRTLDAPATWGITNQLNIGAYHRRWGAQLAYAFRFNYSEMTATGDSLSETFIQHGLILHMPINQVFVRTELYLPVQEMIALVGYQF